MWKPGDLAKAENRAVVTHILLGGHGIPLPLTRDEARRLANALKLIRRHEKISEEEVWARRHAGMAF